MQPPPSCSKIRKGVGGATIGLLQTLETASLPEQVFLPLWSTSDWPQVLQWVVSLVSVTRVHASESKTQNAPKTRRLC